MSRALLSGRDAPSRSTEPRFPFFDGLRAVAAILVFVDHSWFRWHRTDCGFVACAGTDGPADAAWTAIVGGLGPTGVSIFFVISGFLIYRPFVRARSSGGDVALWPYAVRRATRILPAYWLVMAVVLLFGAETPPVDWDDVLAIATLTAPYSLHGLLYSPVPPSWSVCVELTFYLFVPLWALFATSLGRLRRSGLVGELLPLALLAIAGIAWRWVSFENPPRDGRFDLLLGFLPASDKVLMGGFDLFAAGMALAVLGVAGSLGPLARVRPWQSWTLASAIYFLTAWVQAIDGPLGGHWALQSLLGGLGRLAVATLVVLPAAVNLGVPSRNADAVARFLRLPGTVFLGTVSYGLYLWHAPVLAWFARAGLFPRHPTGPEWALAALLGFGATVMAAWLSWRLLEDPLNRLAHRVGRPSSRLPA